MTMATGRGRGRPWTSSWRPGTSPYRSATSTTRVANWSSHDAASALPTLAHFVRQPGQPVIQLAESPVQGREHHANQHQDEARQHQAGGEDGSGNPHRAPLGELVGHEEAGQEPQDYADDSGAAEEAQRAVVSQQREDRVQNAGAVPHHAGIGMAAARTGRDSERYLVGAEFALRCVDAVLWFYFVHCSQ